MAVSTIINIYDKLLEPIPPFTWLGSGVSTLDVSAAFRLCFVLRQLREANLRAYLKARKPANHEKDSQNDIEPPSYIKNIALTLVVVYGGEAVMNPWLSISPSFIYSPIVPGLYALLTTLVEAIPSTFIPEISFLTEVPLSFFDGLTRAYLVCSLIPPGVISHSEQSISSSPWTLLLTSLITANTGFYLVNLLSMLSPTGYFLTTPAELKAYGWTTTDVWCAPVTTALYALLTHAQPIWGVLHAVLVGLLNGTGVTEINVEKSSVEPMEPSEARAICAIFLSSLFLSRNVKNFGGAAFKGLFYGKKKQVIRSKVDGRKLKTKTQ